MPKAEEYEIEETEEDPEEETDDIEIHGKKYKDKIDGLTEENEKFQADLENQAMVIEALKAPPQLIADVYQVHKDGTAIVVVDNKFYRVRFHPDLKGKLEPEMTVSLHRNSLSITQIIDPLEGGLIAKVIETLPDQRVKVAQRGDEYIIRTRKTVAKGDTVIVNPSVSIISENLGRQSTRFLLEQVHETPWTSIGGLDTVIEKVRETIETPFAHPDLYEMMRKRMPKGMLLYGPPGCGKTLMATAIAYNLQQITGGGTTAGCFLRINGPEILDKYVGESEQTIRELFASAREEAATNNHPVIIFIDEAESILKTRGTGISTDIYDSIVPQFLAEMDGMAKNKNILVILATNRQELIDPAILRPGRIDLKMEIPRPDARGTREIYSIYLQELPYDKEVRKNAEQSGRQPHDYLAEVMATWIFRDRPEGEYEDISGATIENSIERAKGYAIKRAIHDKTKKPELGHGDLVTGWEEQSIETEKLGGNKK
ncbi:AAA family ATPase [Candidatus Woesearchaeota archaeon]|nr:AAA family ATPase [Candidatus Woesearchaeota archaeon]